MKRVGILMFQNMRYAPFLKMYQSILDEIGVDYDVIYYNRDKKLNESKDGKYIPIKWVGKGTVAANKVEKLFNFLCVFPHQVKSIIKKRNYDFMIVLTTFPAILIHHTLGKKYDNKFIVDIRDYTQEQFKPYFLIEKEIFSKAALKIISSQGYENFLPIGKYTLCHNMDYTDSKVDNCSFIKKKKGRIIISYIGSISYEKQCKQLINLVENDNRFEFHFYGNETNGTVISDYVNKVNNTRIVMHGAYTPEEKTELYNKSDLIFNCYGYDRTLVKYAISNKYYDSAFYCKPLIVSPNTLMAELSGDYAFPLDLDRLDNLDKLYTWYMNIDDESFEKHTKKILSSAIQDNKIAKRKIIEAIVNS